MRSERRRGTRVASPGSKSFASSTSRPRPRWPMGWTSGTPASLRSTILAAARSTSRFFGSRKASSRCSSTNGDTHLGGDDIDLLLIERVLADLEQRTVRLPDRRAGPGNSQGRHSGEVGSVGARGDRDCRAAGIRLARRAPVAHAGAIGVSTRAEFEALIAPIVERTLEPCRQALADAGLEAGAD